MVGDLLHAQFGLLRILGLMRMVRPGVDLQPLEHLERQLVLGQHSSDSIPENAIRMTGQPPLVIDLEPLPQQALVADLVYAPLETPLLAAARARGLATADGLGMLLHQAVRGFQLWFGVRPDVTRQLRTLVETDLVK